MVQGLRVVSGRGARGTANSNGVRVRLYWYLCATFLCSTQAPPHRGDDHGRGCGLLRGCLGTRR